MTARPGWRAALREALLGDGDRALREVIRQLDLPEDDPPDNLAALALARSPSPRSASRSAARQPGRAVIA